MYLIIYDPWIIRDPNRYYYRSTGEYYNRLIQSVPELSLLTAQNIEEILIYSRVTEDAELSVKTAACSAIRIDPANEILEIEYANIKPEDISCKDVRGRLFHYCVQHDLLIEGKYTPTLLIIDGIQQYTDIKIGRQTARYISVMSQIEDYKKRGNWLDIVRLFPDERGIVASEYWNDIMCLSELSFALAKLAADSHSKKQKFNRNLGFNSERFFLLVSDRCLELEPDASKHSSIRAYYYYELYLTQKREDYYKKACELYEPLVQTSAEWYKEKYRLAKLRQTHYECNSWNGYYSENWKIVSQDILQSYQELVDKYVELDDQRKKQYHKLYLRSLFGYAVFSIDMFFTYWDDYVKLNLYDQSFYRRILEAPRLQHILKVEEYLKQLFAEKNCDDISQVDLQDKPNYLEIQYRLAQIKQIEGIVYVLLGKAKSEYIRYFEKSNEHIEELLSFAKNQKEKNARFNFPHYAKLPKAINLYFLEEYEQCHRCFYHAREYMIYEQGCIYALCKDYDNAIVALSTIPEANTCYNKAQKLMQRIQTLREQNEN